MDSLIAVLRAPWPWYVTGPALGLTVPVLLLLGNRPFGVSSNLRHICAAALPARNGFLDYDWRRVGGWNLAFLTGATAAGAVLGWLIPTPHLAISPATAESLARLHITDTTGWVPAALFSWQALGTWRGLAMIVGGGFLIGFGTAYAGGCTSGHGVTGLADLQPASLVAVAGFFTGGLAGTHLLLPWLLR
jgi:uncharacterized membrane protein YedE/YeeE